MNNISFKYSYNDINPIHEYAFKYKSPIVDFYAFLYKRYIALSDASLLNNPVAISKVATGFYNLRDLFITPVKTSDFYNQDLLVKFSKIAHDTYRYRYSHNVTFNSVHDFDIKDTTIFTEEVNHFDIQDTATMIYRTIDFSIYRTNNLAYKFNDLNVYKQIYLDKNFNINAFKDTIVQKIIDSNIFKTIYNPAYAKNIYTDSVHDIYLHYYKNLNINKNSILKKPLDIVNIMNNYILNKPLYTIDNIYNIHIDNLPNLKALNIDSPLYIQQNLYNNLFIQNYFSTARFNNADPDLSYEIICKSYNNHVLINAQNIASYDIPSILINDTINISPKYQKKDIISIKDPLLSTMNPIKINYYNTDVYFKDTVNESFKFINILVYQNKKITNRYQNINIYKYIKESEYLTNINSSRELITKNDKYTVRFTNYMSKKNDTYTSYLYSYMINKDTINSIIFEKFIVSKDIKHININKSYFNSKDIKKSNDLIQHEYLLTSHNIMDINISSNEYFESRNDKKYFQTTGCALNNITKKLISNDKYRNLFANNSIKDIIKDDSNKHSFLDTLFKDVMYNRNHSFMYRKHQYGFSDYYYWDKFVLRNRNGFSIDESHDFIFKTSNEFSIYEQTIDIYRVSYDFSILTQLFINKDKYDFEPLKQFFINNTTRYSNIYKQSSSILKSILPVMTDYTNEFIIESIIPTDYLRDESRKYNSLIIPISKIRHQGFIDYINTQTAKIEKIGLISNNTFGTVLHKPIFTNYDELFFEKDKHQSVINYLNNQIIKKTVHTAINYDTSFGFKKYKNVYVNYRNESLYKTTYKSWLNYNSDLGYRKLNNISIQYEDVFAYKTYKTSRVGDTTFFEKLPVMSYYSYDNIFNNRKNSQAKIYDISKLIKIPDTVIIDYSDTFGFRNTATGYYDKYIFSSKLINNANVTQEFTKINTTAKEVMTHPNDFGNWAWVYEVEDPFSPTFGIDELLLPEEDTRYQDFENIIFNKRTLKPRNPVKVINETTFIAKYPIRHPLPKYKDIAKNYDDSAVKFENYYGIETEIIRQIFLKYYQIWQAKIFEFGSMDMVQAVKKILEYLYSWIQMYFPVEKLEQALRVFKLIRWYGECAIIQNSQYIIHYEFDTLESKLTTGDCAIPYDLNNMEIDMSLGVIKCTTVGLDSSVEFTIDNRQNTTIEFSLMTSVGCVNIYLNDALIDTLYTSALHLSYEIPFTGDENIVKIEKTASNNLNKFFYIGYIKVSNLGFKDLSIEFDPTIKMGNKPLDEIAQKMMAYVNLYDDIRLGFDQMMRHNLGVQETYKLMKQYWELHHQNKIKGKRLTIKEV